MRKRRVNGDAFAFRPQFMKIQSTLGSNKLFIPDEFVTQLGDELSEIATLTVPNGRNWQVKIKKVSDTVWFDGNGWQGFLDYYGVSLGHGLVFRYEGGSSFHVTIFSNVSGCEIEYPHEVPNVDKRKKKSVETESESDTSVEIIDVKPVILKHKKPSDPESESERVQREKMNTFDNQKSGYYRTMKSDKLIVSTHLRKRWAMKPGDIDKAIQAASLHKLKNPAFMVPLKQNHLANLYVPSRFLRKYLPRDMRSVTVETPNGDKWPVKCYDNNVSGSYFKRLAKGWPAFVRDNYLELGDVCVFELIDRRKIAFRVWIYRVADYVSWPAEKP